MDDVNMGKAIELYSESFEVDGGRAVVNWIDLDLKLMRDQLGIRMALAEHPRGREALLNVAESLRRIAAAGAGSVRGTATRDDVLVVSRSSTERHLSEPTVVTSSSTLLSKDSIEFVLVEDLVAEGRLMTLSRPESTSFEITRPSPLEAEVLRDLHSEGRILYSVRSDKGSGREAEVLRTAVKPTLPIGFSACYQSLPEICRRDGAVGGINGGFFANFPEELSNHTVFNDPVGFLMIDGRVMVPPSFRRGTLFINSDGFAFIEVLDLSMTCFGIAGHRFTGANCAKRQGPHPFEVNVESEQGIAAYTCSYGSASPRGDVVDFVIAGDSLVEARHGGGSVIPQSGFVLQMKNLSLADEMLRAARGSGGDNKVTYTLSHREDIGGIRQGMSAGPVLLKDGVTMSHDYFGSRKRAEEFEKGRLAPSRLVLDLGDPGARAPRSAVGVRPDGHLLMVTVDDDRQTGLPPGRRHSLGATLLELADTMKRLGCTDALNLDGGGSSTLWFRGGVRNRPSDGFTRAISTAITVVPKEQ